MKGATVVVDLVFKSPTEMYSTSPSPEKKIFTERVGQDGHPVFSFCSKKKKKKKKTREKKQKKKKKKRRDDTRQWCVDV